jgi:hypothetical protein
MDVCKIEQKLFPPAFNILAREGKLCVRTLGELMKLRLVLLFSGAILIAAVPVRADGIHHYTIVADSSGGSSGTKLNAPGLLVESGSVGAEQAPDKFFPTSSDMDVHHTGLSSFDSHDRTSFVSRPGGAWWVAEDKDHSRDWVEAKEHRNHKRDWNKEEPTLDPVPEPGSLSLLLSGLLSLGFLANRRAAGTI